MNEGVFYLEKKRIPVFIGVKGSKKKEFEEKFNCKIKVNSKTGETRIDSENPVNVFIMSNVINAINLGHNPDRAMKLEDENYVLDVIDVKSMIRRGEDRLKVVIGRIIGKEGSTRKVIEEITKCYISIEDNFVSVIGPYENISVVHEAIEKLINGAAHSKIYAFLERNKVDLDTGLL